MGSNSIASWTITEVRPHTAAGQMGAAPPGAAGSVSRSQRRLPARVGAHPSQRALAAPGCPRHARAPSVPDEAHVRLVGIGAAGKPEHLVMRLL